MIHSVNRLFLLLLILLAASGIFISIISLFFVGQSQDEAILSTLHNYEYSHSLKVLDLPANISASDSPYLFNASISLPSSDPHDLLFLDVVSSGRLVSESDCTSQIIPNSNLSNCTVSIPYMYSKDSTYSIFAHYSHNDHDYYSDLKKVKFNWSDYEQPFHNFLSYLSIFAIFIFGLILFPLSVFAVHTSIHSTHSGRKYTLSNLIDPFSDPKTLFQKFNSFLSSPYFWTIELLGVVIILLYMSLYSSAWKDAWSALSFLICGAIAFIIPYLWTLGWWYADYREREPLRIIVTFFFWGMLASLMAIGLNSISSGFFEVLGIGVLGTVLAAPIFEELFKGSGIALLSEHPEFNSVEDGIVYGFAIGMGFSFIENWLYFIQNPVGSDIGSWVSLVIVRSIIVSANHGFYTAITGAIIGYLVERKFSFPALGLLVALPIAATLHALHNSSEILTALLGSGGILVYCCLLVPIFDYGGAIAIILLFIKSVVRKK